MMKAIPMVDLEYNPAWAAVDSDARAAGQSVEGLIEQLARIIHGYWESWTVCHGFAEAVQAVINGEDTASVKPWHTPVNNLG